MYHLLAKTFIVIILKLVCYRLEYGSISVDKWNISELYLNRLNQFMWQRPSTSGVLSCPPQQGLGFLRRRNYSPALAALLSRISLLGMWVGPLQIFLIAWHNTCIQTSSGPHAI